MRDFSSYTLERIIKARLKTESARTQHDRDRVYSLIKVELETDYGADKDRALKIFEVVTSKIDTLARFRANLLFIAMCLIIPALCLLITAGEAKFLILTAKTKFTHESFKYAFFWSIFIQAAFACIAVAISKVWEKHKYAEIIFGIALLPLILFTLTGCVLAIRVASNFFEIYLLPVFVSFALFFVKTKMVWATIFIATAVFVSIAYKLYLFRCNNRTAYGLCEVMFGILSVFDPTQAVILSVYEGGFMQAANNGRAMLIQFIAGIYIIIRGFVNIHDHLQVGNLTPGDFVFYIEQSIAKYVIENLNTVISSYRSTLKQRRK